MTDWIIDDIGEAGYYAGTYGGIGVVPEAKPTGYTPVNMKSSARKPKPKTTTVLAPAKATVSKPTVPEHTDSTVKILAIVGGGLLLLWLIGRK